MKRVIFDIETNGLLPELDTVHCISIRDRDTKEIVSYADQEGYKPIKDALDRIMGADRLYGHNLIGFDIPALRKVYPEYFQFTVQDELDRITDTLLCAQLRYAHIEDYDFGAYRKNDLPGNLIGSHKLEAWGHRLGVWKGDYDGGWEEWTPAMSEYCDQDTIVADALCDHLQDAGMVAESVETEHRLAIYLRQQEFNGWPFKVADATELQGKLTKKKQEIETRLTEEIGWWWASNGQNTPSRTMTRRKNRSAPTTMYHVPEEDQRLVEWEDEDGYTHRGYTDGTYTKLKKVQFNPGSRKHIYTVLIRDYGWEPDIYTEKSGEPKVSESILEGLDFDIAEDLVEYLTLKKRLGQIAEGDQAWLRHVEEHPLTGFNIIRHRCYQKPRTHRQAHSGPNLAQVPANYAPYGEECRNLFHAPDGWRMVGADVDGLELRTVAHYMVPWDGGEYAEMVVSGDKSEGTDPHSQTAEALGMNRPEGKTTNYAYLYGAGDEKLGRGIKPAGLSKETYLKAGKKARNLLESNFPALADLNEKVQQVVKDRGYVRLIDGRRAYPAAHYAALNTLIQGTGAIVCKLWLITWVEMMEERYGPQGWMRYADGSRIYAFAGLRRPEVELVDGKWAGLGFIHDEAQIATQPEIAEEAGQMANEAIQRVADHFDFRLPLSADYDIGSSWRETH